MQYNVISGDSHVDMTWMPGDLWVSQAPAKFRAVAPHVVETDEGLKWTAEGKTLGVFGGSSFGFGKAQRGASKRIDTMFDEGFYERPTPADDAGAAAQGHGDGRRGRRGAVRHPGRGDALRRP